MSVESNTSIILMISERMQDPDIVKAFMQDSSNASSISSHSNWSDLSLAGGYPSFVLFFSELERLGLITGGEITHRYVLKIKECLENNPPLDLSLFEGLAGICFALQQASFKGKRYKRMLDTLHSSLVRQVEELYLKPLQESIGRGIPSLTRIYDLIQGLSGIGRYILENQDIPLFLELSKKITTAFVGLSRWIEIDSKNVPGWYLSPEDPLCESDSEESSKGSFNLGLAHGVPGILSFLSISFLKGIRVERQEEAITGIAEWIQSKAFFYKNQIAWPYKISWEEEVQKKLIFSKPSRDAWCYGVPGIARSLFLAGKALGDTKLKMFSAAAFRGIFRRAREEWQIPGPALCHGIAGLLLITYEMAKEHECQDLKSEVDNLRQTLLSYYDPEAPFGFEDVETSHNNIAKVSKLGLLEGVTGVLLTLLSLSDPSPNWHLPFLIHE